MFNVLIYEGKFYICLFSFLYTFTVATAMSRSSVAVAEYIHGSLRCIIPAMQTVRYNIIESKISLTQYINLFIIFPADISSVTLNGNYTSVDAFHIILKNPCQCTYDRHYQYECFVAIFIRHTIKIPMYYYPSRHRKYSGNSYTNCCSHKSQTNVFFFLSIIFYFICKLMIIIFLSFSSPKVV